MAYAILPLYYLIVKEGFSEEWELRGRGCAGWHAFFPVSAAEAHFLCCKMTSKRKRGVDVRAVSQQLADAMGYELVDAAFEKEGPGMYLRFYLDKQGGITLDDCEAFHRKVMPLVEEANYDFLEVCSPGIDRPLKSLKDALKALGQPVEIKLYKPQDGSKEFAGTLVGADSQGYVVDVNGHEVTIPLKAVALAKRAIDVEQVLGAQQDDAEDEAHEQPEA